MKKRKYYDAVRFAPAVIARAYDAFLSKLDTSEGEGRVVDLSIEVGDGEWEFATIEEWLAEYPAAERFRFHHIAFPNDFIVQGDTEVTSVTVSYSSRSEIESVFQIFEDEVSNSIIPAREETTIFIGHGHDGQWRDLKDHLTDQHGFAVVAYEVGPRAGKSVKDVLEEMLEETSLAVLVLTAEDLHADGELHARENVIHELGLFQGRLGFTRAIALVEDGVKEFSNILGINQIRFRKKAIRETFGEVVALIRRESKSRT